MADHPPVSESAVKLLIAAYQAPGDFACRFKVNVGPGPAYIKVGQFEVRDRREVLRLLGEVRHRTLAEPAEKDAKSNNGLWQLTANGIAEAQFQGAKGEPAL